MNICIVRVLENTQGDYGLFQCSEPCCQKTYDNEETVRQMVEVQKDMRVLAELIPHCPVCGKPMNVNLRCDDTFVQDSGWYKANERYNDFVRRHENLHIQSRRSLLPVGDCGSVRLHQWRYWGGITANVKLITTDADTAYFYNMTFNLSGLLL